MLPNTFELNVTGMMRPYWDGEHLTEEWEVIMLQFPTSKADAIISEESGVTTVVIADSSDVTAKRIAKFHEAIVG